MSEGLVAPLPLDVFFMQCQPLDGDDGDGGFNAAIADHGKGLGKADGFDKYVFVFLV